MTTLRNQHPSPSPWLAPALLVALALHVPTANAQEAAPPKAPPTPTQSEPVTDAGGAVGTPVAPGSVEARIDALDQRTQAIVRELEQSHPAASKPGPTVRAEEAGFDITSADRKFQVRMRGQLQVDGRRFFGDDSLKDLDTFLVRRARPTIEVSLAGLADALITPDFAGGTLQLFDAYIDVHPFPWLRLRGGKMKPPVGLERLQADNNLVFTERALDSNLSAQRDVGAQLWGDIAGSLVRYQLGIFNGATNNGLNDVDSTYSKTLVGRLFFEPFSFASLRDLGRLGVGFAASTGSEKGSSAISSGAVTGTWLGPFKSAGQVTIFSYLASTSDTTLTVVSLKRHTRLNPQLYYYLGPVGLEAEYIWERQALDKNGTATTVDNSAGHATLAYVLGGTRTYEGPKVPHRFDLATGGLGALEIGVRYNWLTVDEHAFPGVADPTKSVAKAKGIGGVVSWYPTQSLRFAASYDQTAFTGGAKAGSATGDRKTERILIGRLQVGY